MMKIREVPPTKFYFLLTTIDIANQIDVCSIPNESSSEWDIYGAKILLILEQNQHHV